MLKVVINNNYHMCGYAYRKSFLFFKNLEKVKFFIYV